MELNKVDADATYKAFLSMLETINILDYASYKQELISSYVPLDEDPTAGSLSSLNVKIAKIDALKTRMGYILNEAIENEANLDKVKKSFNTEFSICKATLGMQEKIMILKSQGMRDSAILLELLQLNELELIIEGKVADAKTFTKRVQNVFNSLDSTNKNISRQLTTIQTMVEIGEISRPQN